MKTLCVPEEDALYVRFSDARVVESEEIRPGVVLDDDERGRIVERLIAAFESLS